MGGKNSYESIKKYQDKAYDRIGLLVPKGQKELIQAFAKAQNKSLNAFIVEAIKEKMERENENVLP